MFGAKEVRGSRGVGSSGGLGVWGVGIWGVRERGGWGV